jgi:lipoprotein-anchoring transpeptidase ErfK/SrfK
MGIHGTGDPSSVGKDVSNGCIRMTNDAITQLANIIPGRGVPVEIRA